jgi:nitrate reductase alpha subunit
MKRSVNDSADELEDQKNLTKKFFYELKLQQQQQQQQQQTFNMKLSDVSSGKIHLSTGGLGLRLEEDEKESRKLFEQYERHKLPEKRTEEDNYSYVETMRENVLMAYAEGDFGPMATVEVTATATETAIETMIPTTCASATLDRNWNPSVSDNMNSLNLREERDDDIYALYATNSTPNLVLPIYDCRDEVSFQDCLNCFVVLFGSNEKIEE